MKVKILKNTVAAKQFVKADEIVELEKSEASILINLKKAEAFIEPQVAADIVEAEQVEEKKPAPKKKKGLENGK